MKIRYEFLQDTMQTFSSLYGRPVSPKEAEEIILNCKALLEVLGKNSEGVAANEIKSFIAV